MFCNCLFNKLLLKMFVYLLCDTMGDKATTIFTYSLVLDNQNRIESNTSYLSVFSPNAGKYRPEKLRIWTLFTQWKTNVSCSFIHKVSFKKTCSERKEFFLEKLSLLQGDKMFVGKIFAILNSRKILMWMISENKSLRKNFQKSDLNMF